MTEINYVRVAYEALKIEHRMMFASLGGCFCLNPTPFEGKSEFGIDVSMTADEVITSMGDLIGIQLEKGKSNIIYLDTFEKYFSKDQFQAILAHEEGHAVHNDSEGAEYLTNREVRLGIEYRADEYAARKIGVSIMIEALERTTQFMRELYEQTVVEQLSKYMDTSAITELVIRDCAAISDDVSLQIKYLESL